MRWAFPSSRFAARPNGKNVIPNLWEMATENAERSEVVSPEVLTALATTVNPDGVVATAQRRATASPSVATDLGIALETLQDPGNLGTIIRTATAAGAGGLWLSGDSVDVDQPKVLRASAGAWFRLPIIVSPDLKAEVGHCRQQGVQVIATASNAPDTYWEIDYRRPTLILLGNEGAGLSANLVELADRQVKIPLKAGVESLNVAIAAALILYEAQRQRGSTPENSENPSILDT